jgi:hypothetical protein
MNQPPDPTQYKLGDTIFIQLEAATLELKCISDGGNKVWQLVEVG